MIYITTGTVLIPFDRMLQSCLTVHNHTKEKIHVQHGVTKIFIRKASISYTAFVTNKQMISELKKARLVISAGGEASIFQLLEYTRFKPILFPRLKKFGEHVDNQQLLLAKHFEKKGFVYCVQDNEELQSVVDKININPVLNIFKHRKTNTKIVNRLITFTEKLNEK